MNSKGNNVKFARVGVKTLLITSMLILAFNINSGKANAINCMDENGSITIDGTPMPDMHNCPMSVIPQTIGSSKHIEVHVDNPVQVNQTVEKVIQIVVTATPTPTVVPISPIRQIQKTYWATPTVTVMTTKISTPSPTINPVQKAKAKIVKRNFVENLGVNLKSFFSRFLHFF